MKKKTKVKKNELVFDNKKREDFLKGFSKRKKQRQKKAQEEIELKLKAERKKIREEAKNLKEKFKQSFQPIDDLKNFVDDENSNDDNEEFETDEVKVIVKSMDLPQKKHINDPDDDSDGHLENLNFQNDHQKSTHIEGMEIDENERKYKLEHLSKSSNDLTKQLEINSKKDLKRLIDKHTKSAIKKSDIIKKKNLQNHKRNVKLSRRKKHFKTKFLKKHKKISIKS